MRECVHVAMVIVAAACCSRDPKVIKNVLIVVSVGYRSHRAKEHVKEGGWSGHAT